MPASHPESVHGAVAGHVAGTGRPQKTAPSAASISPASSAVLPSGPPGVVLDDEHAATRRSAGVSRASQERGLRAHRFGFREEDKGEEGA